VWCEGHAVHGGHLRQDGRVGGGRLEWVPVLYMVIERYLAGPRPVYARAAVSGRMLPEGLEYVGSWVVDDGGMDRCFQLMETSDAALFDVWFARWSDLVSFEVLPVITSAEAAALLFSVPLLGSCSRA
jgi:Protein of unknown function (DUF3303)